MSVSWVLITVIQTQHVLMWMVPLTVSVTLDLRVMGPVASVRTVVTVLLLTCIIISKQQMSPCYNKRNAFPICTQQNENIHRKCFIMVRVRS